MHRIALIYDARLAYDLKVMTGVAAYLQEGAGFSVYIEENALKDQRLPDLASWEGDGIIADFDDPVVSRAVLRSRLPAVAFGSGYGWYVSESSIPYFLTNNQAIAKLAVDHLMERGLRQFAYCGYARTPINGWSEERERAFAAALKKRRLSCAIYHGHHKSSRRWASVQRSIGEWLGSLPKPVGVMAANDNRARQVLEACREYHLRVPQEVAVIGVDNDELLCHLSTPLLSSIEQGARQIGYDAAVLLDRIMHGAKPRQKRFVVDPVGIVTRQSTDVLAIDEPTVAKAMAFIMRHSTEGIKVPDVVNAVAVSRSTLETRFRTTLGHTVSAAVRQAQLEQVRQLVVNTALPLKQVAAKTGFRSVQHLTTLFARSFGQTPARYRRGLRSGSLSIRL
jgi:LacI family transcriptional regulator